VLNHPVLSHDGLLSVFLTEPHLETWRKQVGRSLFDTALTNQ
jgi:sorting nexin-8